MAAPTKKELKSFGDLIKPFQRNTRGKTIEKDLKEAHKINSIDSGIGDKIHDAVNDGLPIHPKVIKQVTSEIILEIQKSQCENKKEYCFLWVLDVEGIKLLWENVENLLDVNKEVKHTNITAGDFAFHGGELFNMAGKIFINNASDRYGNSDKKQWKAVLSYFKKTYDQFEIIDLKPDDL